MIIQFGLIDYTSVILHWCRVYTSWAYMIIQESTLQGVRYSRTSRPRRRVGRHIRFRLACPSFVLGLPSNHPTVPFGLARTIQSSLEIRSGARYTSSSPYAHQYPFRALSFHLCRVGLLNSAVRPPHSTLRTTKTVARK